MTAVLATFVDVRTIKTRSVVQIVLELPIEEADAAMKALGGFPLPSESRWVGIALAPKERKEAEKKERTPFDELQASAQAAILANDAEFLAFMCKKCAPVAGETPAETIRRVCGVDSRSQFNTDPKARNRWEVLKRQFKQYQTDARYAESRTH